MKHYFTVHIDGVPLIYRHGTLHESNGLLTSDEAIETILYAANHGTITTLIEIFNAIN